MRLRQLSISDYDAILRLWKDAGLPHRPTGRDAREHIAREIEQGTAVFLGADVDGKLVGVVLGTNDGRKGWVNRLAVAPPYRGRGIGRRLVEAVEDLLRQQGILIVTCLIEDDNPNSMRFFEFLGYVKHPEIIYYAKRFRPDA